MKPRDISTTLDQVAHTLARLLAGDLISHAVRNLDAHTDSGYPSGQGGGRGPGDPTASKALGWMQRPDQPTRDRKAIPGILRRLRADIRELEAILLRATVTAKEPPKEYKIYCENPECFDEILSTDKKYPDGLCHKCYEHRRRYGLAWPDKRSIQRDGTVVVIRIDGRRLKEIR